MRPPRAPRAGWIILAGALTVQACGARQASVRSDPRGGEAVRVELEARVRADLAALHVAEEEYRSASGRYSYEPVELGIRPSAAVEIDILEATADGFSAIGRSGTVECALFVGTADPPRAYTRTAGEIACRA